MKKYIFLVIACFSCISCFAQPSKLIPHIDSTRTALYPQKGDVFDTEVFWNNPVEVDFRQYINDDTYIFIEEYSIAKYNETTKELIVANFGRIYISSIYVWEKDVLVYYSGYHKGKQTEEEIYETVCEGHKAESNIVLNNFMK